MAKINIPFNGTDYHIDESALASATTELQSHVQTSMAGSGAVIKLGGNTYNVDATKLTNERNAFVSHLGTIAGSGSKVTVNGVEYGVDSTKTTVAVNELETVLGNLSSGDEPIDPPVVMRAAGLYETGTDTMVASWDKLLTDGTVHVDDGVVYTNFNTDDYTNGSSDVLTGDLVLPDDGSITSLGEDAFDTCLNLTSIVIPNGVTSIGNWAFFDCSSLISVEIPESVVAITMEAFCNCSSLTDVYYQGSVPQWYNIEIGINNDSLTNAVIHYKNPGLESDGPGLYITGTKTLITSWDGLVTNNKICVDDGVLSVNSDYNKTLMGDLVLPDDGSITSIASYAFKNCSKLTLVVIPNGVTNIGDGAFYWCGNLTSMTIPEGIISINNSVFHECRNLTEIIIPDNVTSIGNSAFQYCSSLTDVYYKGSEEQWNAISIQTGNSSLTNATIHYNYQG